MLNARFANGAPSNELSQAGVLVRQFDNLDDSWRPWLPCPTTANSWCAKFSDRWATALINANERTLYYETLTGDQQRLGVGGLVLAPSVTIFCAYADDGNSMDPKKVCNPLGGDGVQCIPGCYPVGQQCADKRRDWLCSYPPSQLREALEAHQRRGAVKNNEIVVSTSSVVASLPSSIEAFFVIRGGPEGEAQNVVRVHDAFVREYRLPEALQPPILQLSLHDGSLSPFSTWAGLG